MAKVTLSDLQKSPLDYLYVFASDRFIEKLGKKVGTIIYNKRINQLQLLNTIAVENGSSLAAYQEGISSAIRDQYGMTPAKILVALAEGKNVAGKNWKAGVYGVGDSLMDKMLTYTGDSSVKVDPGSGKILSSSGSVISGQKAIYAQDETGKTFLQGYAATKDGVMYTSLLGQSGFHANTIGTATSQRYADGSAYDGSKASSVWESILTYAPYCIQLIQWILSLIPGMQNRTLITAANTVPAQSEFTYNSGISGNELLLLVGGGAALYALTK